MKVTVLLPKGNIVASSVTGTFKLFEKSIELSSSADQLLLVGQKQLALSNIVTFNPHCDFKEVKHADLIIIPSLKSDFERAYSDNYEMLNWISDQYKKGAHIASLCTGSFLLGAKNLLDDIKCTTHWMFSEEFIKQFPKANFQRNSIITEERRIFTSGGAFSFLNLIVYLIERFFGAEIAKIIKGIYQIDYLRSSQSPFVLFETQKNHSDKNILLAQNYIERNFRNKLENSKIAEVAILGERSLIRRFKSCTGNTPNRYLQRVRIEAAKELLTETDKQIVEIQHEVGYSSYKTFYQIFHQFLNMSPSSYRNMYGKK